MSTENESADLSKDTFKENHCTLRHNLKEKPRIYVANTRETFVDAKNRLRKVEVGARDPKVDEKVVLVVGATGAGKSTLLNGFLNYITGVNHEDNFRLKLLEEAPGGEDPDQAESVTKWITAYTIHHQEGFKIKYTLTLIDTPGYGDTEGIGEDKKIIEQVRELLGSPAASIKHVHAVGFVAQSSLPRLTKTQEYIFESVLSLFGKDIEGNIFMLFTFFDGAEPNAIKSLQKVKAPYQEYFTFNNSTLFVKKQQMGTFSRMFWELGKESYDIFLKTLATIEPKHLIQTREVLENRHVLEMIMNGLHANLNKVLIELSEQKTKSSVLRKHQDDIEKNKEFTFTYKKNADVPTKVTCEPKKWNTNCTKCKRSCCESCTASFFNMKWLCSAIKFTSICKICSCHRTSHEYENFTYEYDVVEVTETTQEMKEKYEEAKKKKFKVEEVLKEIQEIIDKKEKESVEMIENARQCKSNLKEKALRPSPLSIVEYIDLLIAAEQTGQAKGSVERVKELNELKRKEALLNRISEGEESTEWAKQLWHAFQNDK